jgi:ubiquinone biosynthesis protein
LPRLLHQALEGSSTAQARALEALVDEQRRANRTLQGLLYGVVGFLAGAALVYLLLRGH